MTGRLFFRDRGRTDGLIIEEEEERRGRRTIRFRKHFIKKLKKKYKYEIAPVVQSLHSTRKRITILINR